MVIVFFLLQVSFSHDQPPHIFFGLIGMIIFIMDTFFCIVFISLMVKFKFLS